MREHFERKRLPGFHRELIEVAGQRLEMSVDRAGDCDLLSCCPGLIPVRLDDARQVVDQKQTPRTHPLTIGDSQTVDTQGGGRRVQCQRRPGTGVFGRGGDFRLEIRRRPGTQRPGQPRAFQRHFGDGTGWDAPGDHPRECRFPGGREGGPQGATDEERLASPHPGTSGRGPIGEASGWARSSHGQPMLVVPGRRGEPPETHRQEISAAYTT